MSDVKDPPGTAAFGQILAAAGVAPLRKPGEPAAQPKLTPATRRESREQLRGRPGRRAWNRRPHSRRSAAGNASASKQRARGGAAPKASVIDWSALALAVVVPPAGLLLSVAAHIADRRRVGWATTVTKISTGVACVLTIVLAAGTVVALELRHEGAAHDAIVASSAEFCGALASPDDLLSSSTLGWPAVGSTIPLTITAMEQYTARWTSIAAIAPEGIQHGAQQLVVAGQAAVDSVTASRTVDHASNVARLEAAADSSGITQWADQYCQ
ncbi:hypothetical protein B0I08_102435 [Glaciihabitans tibetensis]|uniref:Uncharacterized protein n=1 Tax=Glaciihabitans tibetensis TaxID=1266600 RepID=A0A2T0VHR5_9MICO|nr:hypothetical protein [Glaciihabitans tibetensis]PRY69758.1 hypothetical protein B0I08_102435 [Glaciihabitans tibetensis]